MEKTLRHWMLMALMVLCIGGLTTACEETEDEEIPGGNEPTEKMIVSQKYKDYLSAGGLHSDMVELAELLAHQQLLELQYIKMSSGDWQEPLFSTYDFSESSINRFWEVLGEASEHADEYEAAIQRLQASGALGTNSPTTRGWDNIPFYTAVKLVGCLKLSGKACRAAIVGVVNQSGHAQDAAWLEARYNWVALERHSGATDYADWWNKFSRGEFDSKACKIFGDLMGTDAEFAEIAKECGVDRGGMIKSVAVPMIMLGVNLVLNLTPATTIVAESMEIVGNISNLADSIKGGGATGGTVAKTVSSVAKAAYNHFGKAPNPGGEFGEIMENGLKELAIGVTGDLEDKIATSIDNIIGNTTIASDAETILKQGEKAKAYLTDTDKKSPADIVIAIDQNGNNISIGTPDKDGKTTIVIPGGQEVSVTAVDKTGDKHTERVRVPVGQTVTIEASTTETMNIEVDQQQQLSKPEISTRTKKIEFDAKGGTQSFQVIYNGLFFSAIVVENDAEKWCSLSFNEDGIITVDVQPNPTISERTCTIMAGAWNDDENFMEDMVTVQVALTQAAGESQLKITPSALTFSAEGGWVTTIGNSNVELYHPVFENPDGYNNAYDLIIPDEAQQWIEWSPDNWDGSTRRLQFSLKKNETGQARSATITVNVYNYNPEPASSWSRWEKDNIIDKGTLLITQAPEAVPDFYSVYVKLKGQYDGNHYGNGYYSIGGYIDFAFGGNISSTQTDNIVSISQTGSCTKGDWDGDGNIDTDCTWNILLSLDKSGAQPVLRSGSVELNMHHEKSWMYDEWTDKVTFGVLNMTLTAKDASLFFNSSNPSISKYGGFLFQAKAENGVLPGCISNYNHFFSYKNNTENYIRFRSGEGEVEIYLFTTSADSRRFDADLPQVAAPATTPTACALGSLVKLHQHEGKLHAAPGRK